MFFKEKFPLCDIVPDDFSAVSSGTGNSKLIDELKSMEETRDTCQQVTVSISVNSFSNNHEDFYNFFNALKNDDQFTSNLNFYYLKNKTSYPIYDLNVRVHIDTIALSIIGHYNDIENFVAKVKFRYHSLFQNKFKNLMSHLEKFERTSVKSRTYVVKSSKKQSIIDALQNNTRYYRSNNYTFGVNIISKNFLFFRAMNENTFLYKMLSKINYFKNKQASEINVFVNSIHGLTQSYLKFSDMLVHDK